MPRASLPVRLNGSFVRYGDLRSPGVDANVNDSDRVALGGPHHYDAVQRANASVVVRGAVNGHARRATRCHTSQQRDGTNLSQRSFWVYGYTGYNLSQVIGMTACGREE